MDAVLPRLMTPHEIGQLLSWPPARAVRMARAGQIPHVLLPDGDILFDEADIAQWIATRKQQGGVHAQ
jgi:hypothetical protein